MDTTSAKLVVEFSPPQHGWMQLELRAGDQHLHLSLSQVPFDSLQELVGAVSAFLETGRQGVAHLNGEPDEYEFVFEPGTRSGALRVGVVQYSRGRRADSSAVLFDHQGDACEIGRTMWRAFRKLETQFVPEHWTHSFPLKSVQVLGRLTAKAASEF